CENTNVGPDDKVVEFCIANYPSTRVQVVFEP
ncbi:MAG: GntR family transcriptional regulator, partial [Gemmatimonadaceae bacterium]|nr:GntR family transcriptional regulator [Acetobacteraceae bacterium]